MSTEKTNQSWGGRFSEPVDAFVARFTASVEFDKRLYRHDIMGSIAHATMLAKVGVLNDAERDAIVDGLTQIQSEIEAGQFDWRVDLEDVHMNIEARLTDRIGVTGKKLHTGRSRNDQVATDIRLWLRDEIDLVLAEITRLQQGLLEQAEREAETIMPGFTHLQTAQPVTFGHHLLAWFEMLSPDYDDAPVAFLRRAGALDQRAVPVYRPAGSLLNRQLDHAAKEKPRRTRAGSWQDRPRVRCADGPADPDERPAAGLQQGQPGRQRAAVLRRRHPARLAARLCRHDPGDQAQARDHA